ncbi:hypothetical protein Egran_04678 [Elaphomyces granulatus]|uniref:Uncharacterized protein n=1 Tax=Elaphomyces granulatus TaxID=519963 RepID=A0A232LTW9_9EURO|nr:hypothetical protein Egran_04678 [Elaphomyces granulatus]
MPTGNVGARRGSSTSGSKDSEDKLSSNSRASLGNSLFHFRKPRKACSQGKIFSGSRKGHSIISSALKSETKRSSSTESTLQSHTTQELGTSSKPLQFFRGGVAWEYIGRDKDELNFDLFWPIKKGAFSGTDMLDVEELAPLCSFRGLRSLKITGMMQSYQRYIWQAAWLNLGLEELELEMALEPCIRRGFCGDWPFIKGDWMPRAKAGGPPIYHGQYGNGTIHRSIGVGEYLDTAAIGVAKTNAALLGPTRNRLSISKLSLSGFVVDADPFELWFDHRCLRLIHFKNDCVDAGFYLPSEMRHVEIKFPADIKEEAIWAYRFSPKEDLRLIEMKGGEKVAEWDYRKSKKKMRTLLKEAGREKCKRWGEKAG